jgi:hypothetical protein
MKTSPWRTAPVSAAPRRSRRAPALERLEDRSVPAVAPLPIPGGLPGFHPGDPFEHLNLPGPADAPPPIGNEPSSITNFNGFVGVAHFEGTGRDGAGHTLLWDADLRFMQGTYRGVDGKPHHGTFAVI